MTASIQTGKLDRAHRCLARPGAWIEARGETYVIRLDPDRRSRVALSLNEAEFTALIDHPGLRCRPGGGWTSRLGLDGPSKDTAPDPAGRPGRIDGEKDVRLPDGQIVTRRANLGESPIAWLARRCDAHGQPYLSPAEIAAAERLRRDAEGAFGGASVTMRWDGLPRAGGGSPPRNEPGDRALTAARRVQVALDTLPLALRGLVAQICIHQTSLQLAEREHGLAYRQARPALKAGLQTLARHYGIG